MVRRGCIFPLYWWKGIAVVLPQQMEGHASIDWKYNKDRHVHLLSLWLVIYFSQIRFLARSMRLPTSADFVFTWQEMKQIRPKMTPLFSGIGPMKTIPDSAIKVVPWYHLEAVFHQYVESNSASCQTPSLHMLPFFIDNFGPKYTEWTTTAHEQLPGHHLEVTTT